MLSVYAALQVSVCCFCQSSKLTGSPSTPKSSPSGHQDGLFLLNSYKKPLCAADVLLIFCIDISGSMSITYPVTTHSWHWSVYSWLEFTRTRLVVFLPIILYHFVWFLRSRRGRILFENPDSRWGFFIGLSFCETDNKLKAHRDHLWWNCCLTQFVQEAVMQCVQRLSEQQPDLRVGLITFNHQVHKCTNASKDKFHVFSKWQYSMFISYLYWIIPFSNHLHSVCYCLSHQPLYK